MALEKPISTIRKAVLGAAEKKAADESRNNPESQDYKYVFNLYRQLQSLNPKVLEKVLVLSAKNKELRVELGIELYKTFQQVSQGIIKKYGNRIAVALELIEKPEGIPYERLKKEIETIIRRIFKDIDNQIRNDPQIIYTFSHKEKLLNNALSFIEKETSEVFITFFVEENRQ